MSETLGLKNINMLSKEQYDGIAEPARDELYAVATETYSDKDGNWYRVYPDGWCEQGGFFDNGSNTRSLSKQITLLKPFKDLTYNISVSGSVISSDNDSMCSGARLRTTTSFEANLYGFGNSDYARYLHWEAKGYIA